MMTMVGDETYKIASEQNGSTANSLKTERNTEQLLS